MSTAPDVTANEPVSVVLPVRNVGTVITSAIGAWCDTLEKLGHDWELILIDDGSTDDTAARVDDLVATRSHVRVLRHEARRGFGAALRTGFAEARHPLVFYTALNYPYTPADLRNLLARIDQTDEVFGRKLEVVSGCRTGRPVPMGWRLVGFVYRWFCRLGLGLPVEPLPGWLGLRDHVRSWWVWVVFGVPVADPNSAFKLLRRGILDRFPIQSDGEFVHAEILAKATFLACLMDEVPLAPRLDIGPVVEWHDAGKVFRNAVFHPPAEPTPPVDHSPAPHDPTPAAPRA